MVRLFRASCLAWPPGSPSPAARHPRASPPRTEGRCPAADARWTFAETARQGPERNLNGVDPAEGCQVRTSWPRMRRNRCLVPEARRGRRSGASSLAHRTGMPRGSRSSMTVPLRQHQRRARRDGQWRQAARPRPHQTRRPQEGRQPASGRQAGLGVAEARRSQAARDHLPLGRGRVTACIEGATRRRSLRRVPLSRPPSRPVPVRDKPPRPRAGGHALEARDIPVSASNTWRRSRLALN